MKRIEILKRERDGERHIMVHIFGIFIWASVHAEYMGWFRLFGVGLRWKREVMGLTFSERNGYRKYLKIGKWIFGYLPKWEIK